MAELRQYNPSLKVSRIKELPKGHFVAIGDTTSMEDVIILQHESKMKAAVGKNVKITLPKAFQISKEQTKSLAVKGVPTHITDIEVKEFLNINKISHAKAERLKSKKVGRVLPMFQLEISDPSEAEALISQNLLCQLVTGIVYEVEEFRSPVSVTQCYNCQSFGQVFESTLEAALGSANFTGLRIKANTDCPGSLILEMSQAFPSDMATRSLPPHFAHKVSVKSKIDRYCSHRISRVFLEKIHFILSELT